VARRGIRFPAVLITILCGCGSLALAESRAPPYNGPIIDMHLHASLTRAAQGRPNPATGGPGARSSAELMNGVLRACKKHHIVRAVLNGPMSDLDSWLLHDDTLFMAAPMALGPDSTAPDIEALRALLKGGRARLLGEVTAQYAGLSPDDAALSELWTLAESLDVPIMIHMGSSFPGSAYVGSRRFRLRMGNPLLLEEVLVKHPRLRIWIAHGGLPFEQEMFALLEQYPQVYFDVSTINWIGGEQGRPGFHAFLKRAIDRGFAKRMMFGSDQMIWPDAISLAIEGVDSAPFLTAEQKADIFFNNAARFLRLDPSTLDRAR
jgi:hypothetical protein